MKVLIVSHSYAVEENQKNLVALSEFLNCLVVIPKLPVVQKHTKKKYQLNANCQIILKDCRMFNGFPFIESFTSEIQAFQPDLINIEYEPWSPVSLQTEIFRRLAGIKCPLVFSVKKNTFIRSNYIRDFIKESLFSYFIKKNIHIITASEITLNLYLHHFPIMKKSIHKCIHLGVDTESFAPSPDIRKDYLTAGFCGQLRQRKGVMETFTAFKKYNAKSERKILLHFLGDGPLKDFFIQETLNNSWLKIFQKVAHKEVPGFLKSCDFFVFPSRAEPDHQEHDAHAMMEAMSCGLPIITTRSGINPELIDNSSGIFVDENSPDQIEEAITLLANNSCLLKTMGFNARRHAERNFSLGKTASERVKIFKEIVLGKS